MKTVNSRLRKWAAEVLGPDIQVHNEFPEEPSDRVVFLLYDILPAAPSHANKAAPLQLTLRYLVSASAKDVNTAHDILRKLAFAAMQHPEYELELSPSDPNIWLSLGMPARPSFWLKILYREEREVQPAQLVTEGIEVRLAPSVAFYGRVLSLTHLPIVGAKVHLPGVNLTATTDSKGCFHFSAVPSQPEKQNIVVSYKDFSHRTSLSVLHVPVEIVIKK